MIRPIRGQVACRCGLYWQEDFKLFPRARRLEVRFQQPRTKLKPECGSDYVGNHGVPLHYGLEELHEDWQTIASDCESRFRCLASHQHWRGSIALNF